MNPDDFQSERAGRVIRTRQDYYAFIPHPLPPEIQYSASLSHLLEEARGQLGELAGASNWLLDPMLHVRPAMHREAVDSSRIEGTEADLEDLYLFEIEPTEPPGRPDVREVHNYLTALEYGLSRMETLPVSLRFIREVHARLMEGVRGHHATPGEFRTTQNWIGAPGQLLNDATFVPPPVEQMHEALGEWELYLHSPDLTPKLVRLALIHYQFEAIHPFVDGNGRIGRLLLTLLLCHWQMLSQPRLYLSAFFEAHRDQYYQHLLAVSQKGEWEGWIEFFLTAVRDQSSDALRTARALTDLQVRYREALQRQRISRITLPVLQELFVTPVLTASLVRDRLQASFHTAQKAIAELEQAGIIVEITQQRRNRTWVAREILRILSGRSSSP